MDRPETNPTPPASSFEPSASATTPAAVAAAHRTGELLAQRYELVELLGTGGMGEVWAARDRATGGSVAFKCLIGGAPETAAALREEFARLAELIHPNIVQVHDLGALADGTPYFTMELVEGPPLADALSSADLRGVLAALEGVCAGLGVLHAAGLVHGDVKPANVLVAGGRIRTSADVRLVDFGLAGRVGAALRPRGTPGFAAPEVLDGGAPTPRSDLYGLGVTMYTALTGRSPFPGRTVSEVLRSQRERDPSPLPLRVLGVPGELEHVVLRLLERDPQARPGSAAEVWEALQPVARRLSGAAPAGGAAALVRGALLGRDAELELVESRLESPGPPALVTGVPGVGRSRFLRELALRAELAGGRAVVVSCAGRSDGAREWLRRAGVMLGLERREPTWADVLGALAGQQRVCLALEDLHLGTAADFEVARAALAAELPAGALVVLSWAEPVPAAGAAFDDFRALAAGPWLGEPPLAVALPPLDAERTRRLVRLELGGAVLPEIEAAVHRLAGGLPLWIEAYLLACIEGGAVARADGQWRVPPGRTLPDSLPALETLLESRLAGLSPAARAWLAALAELGGEAAAATLGRVAGTEAEGPALAELRAAALVASDALGDAAVVRAQPLAACELARRGLEPEERRGLAARAAEALSDHAERAAALWLAAEQPQRALDALAGWPEEDLTPARAWARAQLRLNAHEQLGRLLPEHLEEAARAAEKAQRLADAGALWVRYADLEAAGAADPMGAARACLRAAIAHRGLAEYDRTSALLDECERRLPASPHPDPAGVATVRAAVLSERAWIAMIRGDLPAAEQAALRALETAPGDARAERFTAWNRLTAVYPRMGRLEDADRALEQALRLAKEMGDEVAEGRAHANAVFMARLRGDLRGEREHLERAMQVSEKSGLLSRACRDAALVATNISQVGSDADARAALLRAENLARAAGDIIGAAHGGYRDGPCRPAGRPLAESVATDCGRAEDRRSTSGTAMPSAGPGTASA